MFLLGFEIFCIKSFNLIKFFSLLRKVPIYILFENHIVGYDPQTFARIKFLGTRDMIFTKVKPFIIFNGIINKLHLFNIFHGHSLIIQDNCKEHIMNKSCTSLFAYFTHIYVTCADWCTYLKFKKLWDSIPVSSQIL